MHFCDYSLSLFHFLNVGANLPIGLNPGFFNFLLAEKRYLANLITQSGVGLEGKHWKVNPYGKL